MLLLVSCASMETNTKKPLVARIPFPEAEYAAIPTSGTGIVSGQAFLKIRGGDIKVAAGEKVILNPVTSYSNQWYNVSYLGHNQLGPPDQRIDKYLKIKIADAQGRFRFKNVPPGEYYVTTVVSWEAPVGDQGALVRQGARLCKKITVKNHEETKVILKQ
jgi:hypothetical protein